MKKEAAMNLTTSNPANSGWKHIKFQYLTVVAGLAIAASAAVATGGWQASEQPQAARPTRVEAVSITPNVTKAAIDPRVVYFLVGSQLDADIIRAQFDSDAALGPVVSGPSVVFQVSGTAEAAEQAIGTTSLNPHSGALLEVVDMRRR